MLTGELFVGLFGVWGFKGDWIFDLKREVDERKEEERCSGCNKDAPTKHPIICLHVFTKRRVTVTSPLKLVGVAMGRSWAALIDTGCKPI